MQKITLPKIIIVLGMHRSGTSLVSQLVNKLGAYMGINLLEANEYNPDGYWELKELVTLHRRMLDFTNNNWYAPYNKIQIDELIEKFGYDARELIRKMDDSNQNWCWKDPRMVLFLEFWQRLLKGREILYLVVYRHPSAVASSLLKRDEFPTLVSYALYEIYNQNILKWLEKAKNVLLVNYEETISNPEKYKILTNSVNQYLNKTDYKNGDEIQEVVKQNLNHGPQDSLTDLPISALRMYNLLAKKVEINIDGIDKYIIQYNEQILKLYTAYNTTIIKPHFYQIFFANSPNSFNQTESVIVELKKTTSEVRYELMLEPSYKYIRIDPLNDFVIIQDFSVYSTTELNYTKHCKIVTHNALFETTGIYSFDTCDPQIIVENPEKDSRITISFNYLNKGLEALPEIIRFYQTKTKQLILKCDESQKNEENLEKIAQLQQLAEFQKEKISILLEQNDEVIDKNNKISAIIKNKDNIINSLIEKYNESEKVKKGLQRELATANQKNDQLSNELNGLSAVLTATTNELSKLKIKFRILESDIGYRVHKKLNNLRIKIINSNLVAKISFQYQFKKKLRQIRASGYFDEAWYLNMYPDVRSNGMDALTHYMLNGAHELRNPSPFFNTHYYLETNTDVELSGNNPLYHFIKYGRREGRYGTAENYMPNAQLTDSTPYGTINHYVSKLIHRLDSTSDIQLIEQSGLFDAEYYYRNNPDVKQSGINALKHYYFNGWKEGRNTGDLFDENYYLEANPDVKKSKINPLLHYVKYGKNEGRLPRPFTINEVLCSKQAGISSLHQLSTEEAIPSIAVVCHLFYIDQLNDIIKYINNITTKSDVYFTVPIGKKNLVEDILQSNEFGHNSEVLEVENQGRDIAPFILILKTKLQKYELVCKIHTKKSTHDYNLRGWRSYLLNQLLGNHKIVRTIIHHFINNPDLGIAWPLPYPYLTQFGHDSSWGTGIYKVKNFVHIKNHFAVLNDLSIEDAPSYPSGSMFWFRPKALALLADNHVNTNAFEKENGQIDGTLAHAIERIIGILVAELGYKTTSLFFNSSLMKAEDAHYTRINGHETYLFIAHNLSLAGAEMLLLHLLQWIYKHTAIKTYVLVLKKGNDSVSLTDQYAQVSNVIMLSKLRPCETDEDIFKALYAITGPVDCIYGNTIVSATVYDMLKGYGVPYITHIHELGESIKRYISKDTVIQLQNESGPVIACSNPVKTYLQDTLGINKDRVFMVNEFICPEKSDTMPIAQLREVLGLPVNKTLIWGCGTIYWRKGTDYFIETAAQLQSLGYHDFTFIWIGDNYWDKQGPEWGSWREWENFIMQNNLADKVKFLGLKDSPRSYFAAGDMFFLPSREDPYPLVCLEAAEKSLPILCFDESGGMPEFVGLDCGIVIPKADCIKAAQSIAKLIDDPSLRKKLGENARNKLLHNHTDIVTVPQILKISRHILNKKPLVSVIVPIYNQAPFLKQRLDSILNQTFKDYEILILDDCSTDPSLLEVEPYLSYPFVRLLKNTQNSGSPFAQWEKGISMAEGSFIWIAEGDDMSELNFLETLLPMFNTPDINLVFCNSNLINTKNEITPNHYLHNGHYKGLGFEANKWYDDYVEEGILEIENALCVRNTIPNVSAVLFRASEIKQIDFTACQQFNTCGDWYVYIQLVKKGKIAYKTASLNYHRVHKESVVAKFRKSSTDTISDYYKMHYMILSNFTIKKEMSNKIFESIDNTIRKMYKDLTEIEFSLIYNKAELIKCYEKD